MGHVNQCITVALIIAALKAINYEIASIAAHHHPGSVSSTSCGKQGYMQEPNTTAGINKETIKISLMMEYYNKKVLLVFVIIILLGIIMALLS